MCNVGLGLVLEDFQSGEVGREVPSRSVCPPLPQVSEAGSCVAVQMHNLQHKFLHFSLRQRNKLRVASIEVNIRVSLMQAAMFYHHREAADRLEKVSRLTKLALADLKESAAIEELSRSLINCRVDVNSRAAKHRGDRAIVTWTVCQPWS